MANQDKLSAEAHLTAGHVKLEQLRRQFLEYLGRKEREVLARQAAGQTSQAPEVPSAGGGALSEWL